MQTFLFGVLMQSVMAAWARAPPGRGVLDLLFHSHLTVHDNDTQASGQLVA